ncbi:MAG TPA: hypothetical protein PK954_16210, partial [Anaerolineales bacterium]|nr:hypothetical protein [Anaerolineales bacterium]
DDNVQANRDYCYEALQFYLSHDADAIGPGTGLVPNASEDTAYNAVIGANDEAYDCEIPRAVTDGEDKTSALQNYARLRSIYDETLAGALVTQTQLTDTISGTLVTGLAGALVNADINVSKDYRASLSSPAVGTYTVQPGLYGDPSSPGYLDITICNSASEYDETLVYPPSDQTPGDGPDAYPRRCLHRTTAGTAVYMDHPGDPGQSVVVEVTYQHPIITPFLNAVWPKIRLTARREGVVESFRKSREVVLPGGPNACPNCVFVPPTSTKTSTPTPT